MFRKASWIVLTLLIALSMILSACAPAASPEEPAAEQPAVEEPAAVEPPVPAGPELDRSLEWRLQQALWSRWMARSVAQLTW
jgi:hypothetical protein